MIGDACIDEYVYGHCDRLSPEAPIPLLSVTGKPIRKEGMALNVDANVKAFGVWSEAVTNPADEILKTRFLHYGSMQQMLRVDYKDKTLTSIWNSSILDREIDFIIISDYDKGFIPKRSLPYLMDRLRSFNVPIFVDTKKTDLSDFEGCVIKINNHERRMITDFPKDYQIITTMNRSGAIYEDELFPADAVEVSDVTGAGDVFLAALAVTHTLYGRDLKKAIRCAVKLATISVQHTGTYTLTKEDISAVCD